MNESFAAYPRVELSRCAAGEGGSVQVHGRFFRIAGQLPALTGILPGL
jgi:hypothetical protein